MNNGEKLNPIQNFPSGYPWYKKLGSNITYYISQIPLLPRKNLLSKRDIKRVRKIIQPGDIVLGGNFQHVSGIFIEGIVTHAMSYNGKGRVIHAHGHGVGYTSLRKILRTYDTLVLVRPKWKNLKQVYNFIDFLIKNIGKPYDFFFGLETKNSTAYFCTGLINDGLKHAGYNTNIETIQQPTSIMDNIIEENFMAHRILKPEQMIYGNFEVLFTSSNLIKDGEKYIFKKGKMRMITGK